ncbi:D-ribose pyranase [Salisediminibacterium halotolerans]|uniref:D-ribose pyranase n=1 Tax=Salisediminibacterium halotolerans TaxID=517425 RepID=UPI000EB0BA2D|nr:D-ribose pyranase [Salisediminibacterium halotolerans]RLJ75644.1 ribose transport protein RbsD [Actinophytocola xinjiangensis]RPE89498.1 ribose transport protein RbsD [Salisediminibacterium halotolerans]TWG36257.1 ribose transport protein RbsD [Salisediminibacterium halotolerans]GEL09159.1 D-ribose pyranase [Salisediminibacterium halotolerans]
MQKHGILNRDIAEVLAKLGHTDQIVVADCGLPIPDGVKCIDLSLKLGTPSFTDVLDVVLAEMEVEHLLAAEEMKEANPGLYLHFTETYQPPVTWVKHEQLKKDCANVKAVIRTGENTPFANVILQAGVIFG